MDSKHKTLSYMIVFYVWRLGQAPELIQELIQELICKSKI
jgi:hypothetical protein